MCFFLPHFYPPFWTSFKDVGLLTPSAICIPVVYKTFHAQVSALVYVPLYWKGWLVTVCGHTCQPVKPLSELGQYQWCIVLCWYLQQWVMMMSSFSSLVRTLLGSFDNSFRTCAFFFLLFFFWSGDQLMHTNSTSWLAWKNGRLSWNYLPCPPRGGAGRIRGFFATFDCQQCESDTRYVSYFKPNLSLKWRNLNIWRSMSYVLSASE